MRNMDCQLPMLPLKINRKGLSEVIATLLIILLSVALIALAAQFIIPFVKNNLNKSTECLNYKDSLKFKENLGDSRYNCYTNSSIGFSVQTDASLENLSELAGFDLVLVAEGNSKKLSVRNGAAKSSELRMLNQTLTTIQVPLSGEVRTYVHEKQIGEDQFNSMELYPVLSSGRACDISESIKLAKCDPINKS